MKIKVGNLEVTALEGSTVALLLGDMKINPLGYGEIRVNGNLAELRDYLKEGDTVLLVKPKTIAIWVGYLKEITVNEGSTAGAAIEAAGLDAAAFGNILVDSELASEDTEITEGAEVILMRAKD
jgi:sulfur carrier protein ThiS